VTKPNKEVKMEQPEKPYYTDEQMRTLLGIKPSTLRKYMAEGVPKRFEEDGIDFRDIPHNRSCGERHWNKEVVDRIAAGGKISD
jgi:hypothetical protein